MHGDPVITFKDVSFSYDGAPVLVDVNFAVNHRELVYIVGPNGGGKTTLLKLIMGFLKPKTGEISVFGQSPQRARRRLGYVPQAMNFDPQFPITVMEVVLMGRLGTGGGIRFSPSDRRQASAAMEQLGVAELASTQFAELSGGMHQRTLIARALTGDPDMLLLDEPTSNVDPHAEDKLLNLIAELNRRLTVLLVSHEPSFVFHGIRSVLCVNRRVRLHPTSDISVETIKGLYEKDMRLIRHDLSYDGEEKEND